MPGKSSSWPRMYLFAGDLILKASLTPKMQQWKERSQAAKSRPRRTEQEMEKSRRELSDLLFGGEA